MKVLVTGVSGFVGSAVALRCRASHRGGRPSCHGHPASSNALPQVNLRRAGLLWGQATSIRWRLSSVLMPSCTPRSGCRCSELLSACRKTTCSSPSSSSDSLRLGARAASFPVRRCRNMEVSGTADKMIATPSRAASISYCDRVHLRSPGVGLAANGCSSGDQSGLRERPFTANLRVQYHRPLMLHQLFVTQKKLNLNTLSPNQVR